MLLKVLESYCKSLLKDGMTLNLLGMPDICNYFYIRGWGKTVRIIFNDPDKFWSSFGDEFILVDLSSPKLLEEIKIFLTEQDLINDN